MVRIWSQSFDHRLENRPMPPLAQVTEFMGDDISEHRIGRQHQPPVERDGAGGGTTAPAGTQVAQADVARRGAESGGEVGDEAGCQRGGLLQIPAAQGRFEVIGIAVPVEYFGFQPRNAGGAGNGRSQPDAGSPKRDQTAGGEAGQGGVNRRESAPVTNRPGFVAAQETGRGGGPAPAGQYQPDAVRGYPQLQPAGPGTAAAEDRDGQTGGLERRTSDRMVHWK